MLLTQITETSLPELPGTTVLQVDLSAEPAVLLHDLGADHARCYARLLIRPQTTGPGQLAIAGGIDSAGASAWQLVLDPAEQALRLEVGDAVCTASLTAPLPWQIVEVGVDTASGEATLRVNGTERDAIPAATHPTRFAWVGGAFVSPGLAGTLLIDDWAMADTPIGVPLARPTLDHAGDPRRWLVVYNRSDADSAAWAEAYRQRQGVPLGQLCGLDLPIEEVISAAEYASLRQQVSGYLDDNGLRGQVVGVLLGLNVPGYADVAGQGTLTPIAAYLHTDDTHGLPVVNPLYQSSITDRPSASDYAAVRLTGRVDAPSLAEALAMLDRADDLTAQPLTHEDGARVLIDINPDNANVGPVYTQPVADWAGGAGLASLRLPATVYDAHPPSQASDDAVVWGWRDAAPPSGFFALPAGRRALCMQFDPEPLPAVTLRDPDASDWLSAALGAGYAYAAAPSRAYALSSLPLPHLFFAALRRGWTAAEAWLVAQPFVRDGLQLVGDPLMPIPLPKAGYDVFGPAPRLDRIGLTTPLVTLHAGVRALTLQPGDLPGVGEASRYLVRRIDEHGRPDHASTAVFTAVVDGRPIRPAPPAWPTREGWSVMRRGGRLLLSADWPASLRRLGVDAVRLVAQADGQAPAVLDEITPTTGQRRAVFTVALPSETTRYRFSAVQGQAVFDSPWSDPVAPATPPSQPLTVLEAP